MDAVFGSHLGAVSRSTILIEDGLKGVDAEISLLYQSFNLAGNVRLPDGCQGVVKVLVKGVCGQNDECVLEPVADHFAGASGKHPGCRWQKQSLFRKGQSCVSKDFVPGRQFRAVW